MFHDPTMMVSLLIIAFTVAGFIGLAIVTFNTPANQLMPKTVDGVLALKRRTQWPRR